MWDFFKKEPKSVTIVSDIKVFKEPVEGQFRENMWVVSDNRVGILHKLKGVNAEVHYTNDIGETTVIVHVTTDTMRQAKYTEIPMSRRNISLQTARSLGYGD